MIGALLITHGPLAQALISASEEIFGKIENIYGFSITNLSIQEVIERIENIFEEEDWPKETLIFVCLKGGSCWNVAINIKKQHGDSINVVSGVNLNMVLSFITRRNTANLNEITTKVLEDGVRGIDKF